MPRPSQPPPRPPPPRALRAHPRPIPPPTHPDTGRGEEASETFLPRANPTIQFHPKCRPLPDAICPAGRSWLWPRPDPGLPSVSNASGASPRLTQRARLVGRRKGRTVGRDRAMAFGCRCSPDVPSVATQSAGCASGQPGVGSPRCGGVVTSSAARPRRRSVVVRSWRERRMLPDATPPSRAGGRLWRSRSAWSV